MHDRRDGIEESESGFTGERADGIGKVFGRKRAGGDDDVVPVGRRRRDFLAPDFDQRLAFKRRGDRCGKAVAIDRERAAGRKLMRIGRAHDQRAEPAHFGVQKSDGARLRVVGAERIGANELGEVSGLMRCGRAHRPHFVHYNRHAPARDLPGGFGTGKAAADHVNGCKSVCHAFKIGRQGRVGNAAGVAVGGLCEVCYRPN